MMSRRKADALGLPVVATIKAWGTTAGPLSLLPSRPAPSAAAKCGLDPAGLDLYELNEAFASVAMAGVDDLGLSEDRVNVNGGPIAMGQPFGCTGARITVTLISELKMIMVGVPGACGLGLPLLAADSRWRPRRGMPTLSNARRTAAWVRPVSSASSRSDRPAGYPSATMASSSARCPAVGLMTLVPANCGRNVMNLPLWIYQLSVLRFGGPGAQRPLPPLARAAFQLSRFSRSRGGAASRQDA